MDDAHPRVEARYESVRRRKRRTIKLMPLSFTQNNLQSMEPFSNGPR